MIREVMIWTAETLFYLLNGVPLASTLWVFVWVLFWTQVMVLPIFYTTHIRPTVYSALIALAVFFPGLMMVIGPAVVQQQMLKECETVQVEITTDRVEEQQHQITVCRHKDNFYGEFGEWQINGTPQQQENDNG